MKDSNIEWTDHTFNPWIGCTKVSPGCTNCYAETLMDTRYKRVKWGKGNPRQRTSASYWKQPLKWNKDAAYVEEMWQQGLTGDAPKPQRPRVFCASLADWLDDEVPIEWLADLLKLIHDTPNLDWLLLTKRPENWATRISAAMQFVDRAWMEGRELARPNMGDWIGGWLEGIAPQRGLADIPRNIWIGTSVEDGERAEERIPELRKIPAKVRFLSCEPLLEFVELPLQCANCGYSKADQGIHGDHHLCKGDIPGIDWVIVGGESGPGKRAMKLEWARSLRDQCKAAGVAYFMKQIDKVQPIPDDLMIREFPKQDPQ